MTIDIKIKEITDSSSFKDQIVKGEVIVKFSAKWCSKCQGDAIPEELQKHLRKGQPNTLIKIDIDLDDELNAAYQIKYLPTYIVFKDGQEVARLGKTYSIKDTVPASSKGSHQSGTT